jgi:hypothetical protein
MTTPAPHPLPGDYAVTRTSGRLIDRIAAWAIRFDTATKVDGKWVDAQVNHAFLYVGDGVIVEAVGKVRYNDLSAYPDAIWSTGRLPAHLTPDATQRQQIVNRAHDLIGRRYNWLDIVAIGLAQRRLGQVVSSRTWWARRVGNDSRLICSQAVDVEYLAAEIHLFRDGRIPGLVSPQDLDGLLLPVGG